MKSASEEVVARAKMQAKAGFGRNSLQGDKFWWDSHTLAQKICSVKQKDHHPDQLYLEVRRGEEPLNKLNPKGWSRYGGCNSRLCGFPQMKLGVKPCHSRRG